MITFKGFLNEMYNFFPKSVEEIDKTLTDFSPEAKEEIGKLFTYLKGKSSGSKIPPINIDLKKQNHINISRSLKGIVDIPDVMRGADLKRIKLKFGDGSSGNRGSNNRGNLFEGIFAKAMQAWWDGEPVTDKKLEAAILDLDKTYAISKSKTLDISVEGAENTKRPIEFGPNIILKNPKGSGFDVGQSVTDITLTTDTQKIFLSLKLGGTTTFFNVGVKTKLTTSEIKSGTITNTDGLKLLKMFGIDPIKFCQVFNEDKISTRDKIDRRANYDKLAIGKLLQSGIGHNYHIIHKMSAKIVSKHMDERAMKKAAMITSGITVYYGGKKGKGKRIDVEFESASYIFKINIRDTQGTDGYPTRMMCDFKTK
jgi:hypothetical protein